MKEGQKLYNWLHLAAGHALIFANISWASMRQTCLRGFRQSETQPSYIDCLEDQNYANYKGADQSARSMRRLVCAFVVLKPPKTGFLASRPI